MICQACGYNAGESDQFCGKCGAKILTPRTPDFVAPGRVLPVIQKPVLKRRDYFRTVSDRKVRNKITALNILTGIMLAICAVSIIYDIVLYFRVAAIVSAYERIGAIFVTTGIYEMITASVLFAVFSGLFCVFGLIFKHYGFYIPLLFTGFVTSIYLLIAIFYTLILTFGAGPRLIRIICMIICLILIAALLIAMLVVSILVTRDYGKYKKYNRQF